ncbi:MAG: sulfur carrier protein ThiS [Arthrobacter sp.]|uniref:sulfur carrier protein ThiS n=1 Tax=unclassified Arthrobacter TaxID=235627 RepID=UPI00264E77B7|nr:sulfur carrier protein ThiS [Micrococcaceae bacterium]MDN5812619.1 sulfur carrier protein ThiS [Micrococcaceae bacterium]MDN5824262.1 sulfur carrier protein ThiS [Micrococcaceae bacterium]MDN5880417.1 sulfur carrier protein ThiS [Micrococcaceae bacterium]MDN5887212.1 sulfur carrier protein ThiS [Micrococcaceae bacterium]
MNDTTPPLILNGQAEPHAALSVLELIQRETGLALGADGRTSEGTSPGLAAAVNDEVVPRSAWARTRLQPGDRIELLSAVQGG